VCLYKTVNSSKLSCSCEPTEFAGALAELEHSSELAATPHRWLEWTSEQGVDILWCPKAVEAGELRRAQAQLQEEGCST